MISKISIVITLAAFLLCLSGCDRSRPELEQAKRDLRALESKSAALERELTDVRRRLQECRDADCAALIHSWETRRSQLQQRAFELQQQIDKIPEHRSSAIAMLNVIEGRATPDVLDQPTIRHQLRMSLTKVERELSAHELRKPRCP